MFLIIDGYNLLHATGIMGRGAGPGGLARSRQALLNFLAASLDPDLARRTTVVFDAATSPGRPRALEHAGIRVVYAAGYDDADTLIEELISQHSSPRRLVVVSSDHRVQRAARRRRAKPIDSDVWYAELMRHRREQARRPDEPVKTTPPLTEAEVQYWLDQFHEPRTGDATRPDTPADEPPPAD